jgi:hypothetical protein
MKKLMLYAFAGLLIFSSCKKANKIKESNEPAKQITGTWVWAEQSTNTPNGEVVVKDFGKTMGYPVEGMANTKIVFNSDGTAQNIVELKPRVNTGKWEIGKDSIKVVWQNGRTQSSAYKLIGNTIYVKLGDGKTTVKFVKKS